MSIERHTRSAPRSLARADRTGLQVLPCRLHDADLWFGDTPEQVERAKELCLDCPLLSECLEAALRRAEPCGVWGGQLLVQGQVVARKRPRGRPRKVVAA